MTIQDQRVAAAEMLEYSDIKEETIWPNTPYQKTIWTGRQPDLIGACVCEIPNCPEDTTDALLLLAAMEKDGWYVKVHYESGWWNATFCSPHQRPVKMRDKSLALAITQAALRAKGRWVQEGEGK